MASGGRGADPGQHQRADPRRILAQLEGAWIGDSDGSGVVVPVLEIGNRLAT